MSAIAQSIKQRLSLRTPLQDALDVVVRLSNELEWSKDLDPADALAKVKVLYPTCTDFERDFPSICFSIATGVGKTRLMGAIIAYLYLEKGIRNFFVLAPNLTIYEKLVQDFGDPGHPKYVFKGIAEFVHNRPVVITGENYDSQGGLFREAEVRINVFNISKFNKDAANPRGADKGKPPRIKRIAEVLGQSYWDYLSGLTDLVLLMDEAHRYRADASAAAINELKPVFGIELTATPLVNNTQAFRNVVFEYNLAQALEDGKYVKSPAIAYRKDLDKREYSEEEMDRIKLEDALSLHAVTKAELEVYSKSFDKPMVKPFVLVVCRDIEHARETLDYVQSGDFYHGQYAGKAIQIDSRQNDDEVNRLLETVEQVDNPIEIVIHVNMLAEGWDVTNLYTICPLRKADAIRLVEQTIGRGLRLPYQGERTQVEAIDRLTVVAHDNFEKVIEQAQSPDSILKRFSYVELTDEASSEATVAVTSTTKTDEGLAAERTKAEQIEEEPLRKRKVAAVDAKKAIVEAMPELGKIAGVNRIEDLRKPEFREQAVEIIKQTLDRGQLSLDKDLIIQEIPEVYDAIVRDFQASTIEIPRISLVQDKVRVWFEDFDLDTTSGFDQRKLAEEIEVMDLKSQRKTSVSVRHGAAARQSPMRQLIASLIDYPEIDYDQSAELLNKLVGQALAKLRDQVGEDSELAILVRQYRVLIAKRIYDQMMLHFRQAEPDYMEPKVLPFTRIEPWNFTMPNMDGVKDYRPDISPRTNVRRYVFMGFEKSAHARYKFDSHTEKDFAVVLESDAAVLKWLRPAETQFLLYWDRNSKRYHPDFIVETPDGIWMIEVKAADEVNTDEVKQKKKAGETYCAHASAFTQAHGGKPWAYALIADEDIRKNATFGGLLNRKR
jgi:type III restriction enzyme